MSRCFRPVVWIVLAMTAVPAALAEERQVSDAEGLAAAVRAARPGDVVVIDDGTWRDVDILLEARGTPEAPVTARARTPGRVVLTGRSRLRIGGAGLVVDGLWFKGGEPVDGEVVSFRADSRRFADHCRLTNCAITDYNPMRKDEDSKWVSLYGTHNRVDRCYLAGKTNLGQTLVVWVGDGPNEHRIDHNLFGHRPPLRVNGGETVRVGTSDRSMVVSRTVVEANVFEGCDGEIEVVSNKSCENTYRHNLFLGCQGTLTLRHGNRCTVEANVFLGDGKRNSGGVRVIGEDHRVVNNYFEGLTGTGSSSAMSLRNGIPDSPLKGYFQVKRAVIAFNTFVDCRSTFAIGLRGAGASLPPESCTIADNVVLRGGSPLVRVETAASDVSWRGNIMFGAEPGLATGTGVRVIDPKLSRGADGLWRPSANSPVIGAAVGELPFVADDLDGQPRGPRKDVGCDQWSPPPVPRSFPRPDEVGPSWRRGLASGG
jgi:poly(beta-D-mannuronate) lyase